jgi:acetyl esterase/lipase
VRPLGGQGSHIRLSSGRHRSQAGDLWLAEVAGAGAGEAPVPVVVVLHGGFWTARYGKRLMDGLAADLAGRGWAAWNLEYRRVARLLGGPPARHPERYAAASPHFELIDPATAAWATAVTHIKALVA